MRLPHPARRVGELAGGVVTTVRRLRDGRRPRVRVRLAHGEPRVLPEGDPQREPLLSLASELVGEYGRSPRGGS